MNMYELTFHMPDGSRDTYFHASFQSAKTHRQQFKGWVKAEIIEIPWNAT